MTNRQGEGAKTAGDGADLPRDGAELPCWSCPSTIRSKKVRRPGAQLSL